MKKVMVLLGAVAFATVLQAASVKWTANAGTAYAGYDVYIAKAASYATLQALQADLLGTSGNSGALAAPTGARSATATASVDGLALGTSYDFYMVFVKDDNFWVSSKMTATTPALETDSMPSVSLSQTNGTALLGGAPTGSFAVPEPTSGLLLLLGMAGLALKRKRA